MSPWRADRAAAPAIIGEARFLEVHVASSLAVSEARDPKGMYARARCRELAEFTGVSSRYEAQLAADLTLDRGQLSLPEVVGQPAGRIGRHAPAEELGGPYPYAPCRTCKLLRRRLPG